MLVSKLYIPQNGLVMDEMVVKKVEAKQCLYCRPGIILLTQVDYGQASSRLARTAGTGRNVPTGSSSAVVEHPSRYLII